MEASSAVIVIVEVRGTYVCTDCRAMGTSIAGIRHRQCVRVVTAGDQARALNDEFIVTAEITSHIADDRTGLRMDNLGYWLLFHDEYRLRIKPPP